MSDLQSSATTTQPPPSYSNTPAPPSTTINFGNQRGESININGALSLLRRSMTLCGHEHRFKWTKGVREGGYSAEQNRMIDYYIYAKHFSVPVCPDEHITLS